MNESQKAMLRSIYLSNPDLRVLEIVTAAAHSPHPMADVHRRPGAAVDLIRERLVPADRMDEWLVALWCTCADAIMARRPDWIDSAARSVDDQAFDFEYPLPGGPTRCTMAERLRVVGGLSSIDAAAYETAAALIVEHARPMVPQFEHVPGCNCADDAAWRARRREALARIWAERHGGPRPLDAAEILTFAAIAANFKSSQERLDAERRATIAHIRKTLKAEDDLDGLRDLVPPGSCVAWLEQGQWPVHQVTT